MVQTEPTNRSVLAQDATDTDDAYVRIIGGIARGRTIAAPRGVNTRPTTDRVREALFSALQARIDLEGLAILDLYAGSGSLGLEALSRGAESAVFVDQDHGCCRLITSNAENLGFADRCKVIRLEVDRALSTFASRGGQFDLVFIDAPYRLEPWSTVSGLIRHDILHQDALVVVEHSKRLSPPPAVENMAAIWHRCYGDTALTLLGTAPP